MAYARIVLLCVAVAVGFGVVHNQVTVSLSPEYFTIGHASTFEWSSVRVRALGLSLLVGAWLGASLGALLAAIAQNGKRPRLRARDLARPLAMLLLVAGCTSAVLGGIGYGLGHTDAMEIGGRLADLVPEGAQERYLAVRFIHGATYFVAIAGGLILCIHVWILRRNLGANPTSRSTPYNHRVPKSSIRKPE